MCLSLWVRFHAYLFLHFLRMLQLTIGTWICGLYFVYHSEYAHQAAFQLTCVFQLILLPDVLYFVLAIKKHVFGLNYSDDGSWMKGLDLCTQWQDICMRSLLTLVADTLAQGQILFGIAMATALTVEAVTQKIGLNYRLWLTVRVCLIQSQQWFLTLYQSALSCLFLSWTIQYNII